MFYKSGDEGFVEEGPPTSSREVITGSRCDFITLISHHVAGRAPPSHLAVSTARVAALRWQIQELLLEILRVITCAGVSKEGCLLTQGVRKHFLTN